MLGHANYAFPNKSPAPRYDRAENNTGMLREHPVKHWQPDLYAAKFIIRPLSDLKTRKPDTLRLVPAYNFTERAAAGVAVRSEERRCPKSKGIRAMLKV